MVILLFFFVKEKKKKLISSVDFQFNWRNLDPSFKVFLFISFIFALGNSSNAFLILRAQNLGLSVTMVMLAYVLFNFVYAGFLLFAVIYLIFGLITKSLFLWLLFPLYGIYMALTEGIGKAYISNLIPQEKAGTAFGIYQTTIGLCTFFASWIAGLLWSYISLSVPFIFGSVMAMSAAFLFYVFGKR